MLKTDFTWFDFIFNILIILGVVIVYFKYFRNLIYDRIENKRNLFLIERTSLVIGFMWITYLFICINPIINGIVAALFIFLTKSIISNFLMGILLIKEISLKEGNNITIKNNKGIISQLSYTGIQVTSGDTTEYISFENAFNLGIKQENNKNSTYISLLAESDNISYELIENVQSKLFSLPFIIPQQKPIVEKVGNTLKIQVGIYSYEYKESLIDALEQEGLTIKII